jgi:hypothetical protein
MDPEGCLYSRKRECHPDIVRSWLKEEGVTPVKLLVHFCGLLLGQAEM